MPAATSGAAPTGRLPALLPRGSGHQFVFYGDSCSGIAGAAHEKTFASVNAVVRRLTPPPEFVLFLGDEIAGLTADPGELKAQWRHWLDREMAWLDRQAIPLWNTTSNHTTYDEMSEGMFCEMLRHLPRNGPRGQEGLSYWVRRGDLLLVFVHTGWTGLGGEGHVETAWLRAVLHSHADARHKLVVGHHPVHPINGFSGAYQREIGPEHAAAFWDVLVEGGVFAYLCSHILAFDVQVHRGVLQVCSAGAGTAHRMPEGIEYLHCVQGALDADGLRYQVLDADGRVREGLSWPLHLPDVAQWRELPAGESEALLVGGPHADRIVALRFTGRAAPAGDGSAQTLLSAFRPDLPAPLWIGLRGVAQRLTVIVGPEPRRSPHYWYGPVVPPDAPF
ncbi:MAG: metallophosphoesterase family protein, partial [Reyranella sp.]